MNRRIFIAAAAFAGLAGSVAGAIEPVDRPGWVEPQARSGAVLVRLPDRTDPAVDGAGEPGHDDGSAGEASPAPPGIGRVKDDLPTAPAPATPPPFEPPAPGTGRPATRIPEPAEPTPKPTSPGDAAKSDPADEGPRKQPSSLAPGRR